MALFRKAANAARYLRMHGIGAAIRRILGRAVPVQMLVEAPLHGSGVGGEMTIYGWAFSTAGKIRRVDVLLNGQFYAALSYGLRRADVGAHYGIPDAFDSGFEGRVTLPVGTHRITVRAEDSAGNLFDTRLRVYRKPFPPTRFVVERAVWHGDRLSVAGWAQWPQGEKTGSLQYKLNGAPLGTSRCNLSRPDIVERFPSEAGWHCRGFSFETTTAIDGDSAELRVEFGEIAAQTVRISRESARDHRARDLVAAAVGLYRVAVDPDPEILDWHTGIHADFPKWRIFTPAADEAQLPYLDASADFVVYSDPARRDEALRIARVGVIAVGQPSGVEWKAGRVPKFPSVSIIVPVYNHADETRACLDQLRETLPSYFGGEIIVADDASTDGTPVMLAAYVGRWPLLKIVRSDENGGFIDNCNRAAAVASGDYLLFLNNDTLPQNGWLDALLGLFRRYPDAGAVGGKLIFPDGTLQEAGGLIFPDGEPGLFGGNDAAINHPLYQHVREVDYCSGALLLTPRALFEHIGGFDPRYKPAYFEDVDYCFAVRRAGYKVYFQPDSVVIHTAHVSHDGVAERVTANRAVFVEKWGEICAKLAPKSDNRDLLVDRQRRKKVLFFGSHLPEFDRKGGWLRLQYLVDALEEAGWAVTFYAQDVTGAERYADLFAQRGIMVYGGEPSRNIGDHYLPDPAALIAGAPFDLAIASSWWMAARMSEPFRTQSPRTRLLVDACDVHFLRFARARLSSGQPLDDDLAREVMRELNAYAAVDAALAVSEIEAVLLNTLLGMPDRVLLVPNMVGITPSPFGFAERAGIVFVGSYSYAPNIEAVTYLVEQVLPLMPPKLLAEHPLYVVGENARDTLAPLAEGRPHVRLVDWVPEISPYFQRSRVMVAPVLNGAGTKTKLILALANHIPAVSTTLGAEGVGLEHERHILIADNAAQFAQSLARLLTDPVLWNRLAAAGHEHIQATHGEQAGKRRFLEIVDSILARPESARQRVPPSSRSSK